MTIVYLCGAINGCTDEEAIGWRTRAKRDLRGCDFLDPMRRDYRGREGSFAHEIVSGDLADIDACDVVLAAADTPSWGTAMEIFYAASILKPVIAVCSNPTPSPWLSYHVVDIVPTLKDACDTINFEYVT